MIKKFIFGKPFETDATVLQIAKENKFVQNEAVEELKSQNCEVLCSENDFSFAKHVFYDYKVPNLKEFILNLKNKVNSIKYFEFDDKQNETIKIAEKIFNLLLSYLFSKNSGIVFV